MKFATLAAGIACLAIAAPLHADLAVIEVVPGIYRGPAPETAADFRQLRDLGIRTVLDLRKFRKRKMENTCRCTRSFGMNYLRVPVAFRPQRDGSAERAFRALTNVCRHPIYIHCELGRDRSGLVVALYRVRCQGWSLQAAYCEMKRLGFSDYLPALERYFWDYARRRP
jgi:hypothetical protein